MSKSALICGSSRGIGLGLLKESLANPEYEKVFATYRATTDLTTLVDLKEKHPDKLNLIEFDAHEESSYERLARAIQAETDSLDLCINSIGVLWDSEFMPERSLKEVSMKALLETYQVNSIASLMLAQSLRPLLDASTGAKFAAISAKVGSISDNKLGGWYSYRMSKAALNMAIKNLSIELGRRNKNIVVMAIHPGTTDTNLSEPFIESAKRKYTVHPPVQTAQNIMKVINEAEPKTHNGSFYSWDGTEIDW